MYKTNHIKNFPKEHSPQLQAKETWDPGMLV